MATSFVTRVITQTSPPNLLAGLTMRKSFGVDNIEDKGSELDGYLQTEVEIEN